jgi:hypothetical protein
MIKVGIKIQGDKYLKIESTFQKLVSFFIRIYPISCTKLCMVVLCTGNGNLEQHFSYTIPQLTSELCAPA